MVGCPVFETSVVRFSLVVMLKKIFVKKRTTRLENCIKKTQPIENYGTQTFPREWLVMAGMAGMLGIFLGNHSKERRGKSMCGKQACLCEHESHFERKLVCSDSGLEWDKMKRTEHKFAARFFSTVNVPYVGRVCEYCAKFHQMRVE